MLICAFHDFNLDRKTEERACKFWPGIAAVGENLFQSRIFPERLLDQTGGTVAILDIGRNYLEREEVAFRVDEGVALNAFSFLGRIIADRINGDPPFSVAFATCVSMIAAVGSRWRPQASRHLCSRV